MDARKSLQVAGILLAALAERFKDRENLSLYQIGSSVSSGLWGFNDIDVLLVDRSNQGGMFENSLSLLRASIGKGTPHAGAFISTDKATQGDLELVLNEVQAKLPEVVLRAEFSFGPLKAEPRSDEIVLHVCGPLSLLDLEALARHLPFHALGFLAKNRAIVGPPLVSALSPPKVNKSDLLQWLDAMLSIEESTAPLEYKLKARRRATLCYLLYKGDASPYEKVGSILRQLEGSGPLRSGDLLQRYEEIYQNL